jgi:hypothetical protein
LKQPKQLKFKNKKKLNNFSRLNVGFASGKTTTTTTNLSPMMDDTRENLLTDWAKKEASFIRLHGT